MTKDRHILILLLSAAALFHGCSGEELSSGEKELRNPVSPSVGVVGYNDRVEATGFSDGDDLFRICAFMTGAAGEPADWTAIPGTEAFENEPVDVKGGVPVIRTPKYFPPVSSGRKLWFYAYAPTAGATYIPGHGINRPAVSFTITGQEDIMVATVADNGIGGSTKEETQRYPSLRFHHLLTRVTFRLVKGEGFASDINASSVGIADCHTKARVDIVTGALTFEDEPTTSLRVTGSWAIKSSEEAHELPNVHIMCQPGKDMTVEVVVAGVTFRAPVRLEDPDTETAAGSAGVTHLVTLTFKGTKVEAFGTIVPWDDVGGVSGEIK